VARTWCTRTPCWLSFLWFHGMPHRPRGGGKHGVGANRDSAWSLCGDFSLGRELKLMAFVLQYCLVILIFPHNVHLRKGAQAIGNGRLCDPDATFRDT
jgi:hypothetical protein